MSIIPDFSKVKVPSLKPILFIHLEAEEPEIAYSTKAKTLQHVPLTGGFVKSLDPSLPFDYEVIHGTDDITAYESNPSIGNLDCKLFLKSKDGKGRKAFAYYTGVVGFAGKVTEVVSKQISYTEFEDGYVTNHPVFVTESEDEKWINDINFLGKGRFVRDDKGTLCVQYYVYTFA